MCLKQNIYIIFYILSVCFFLQCSSICHSYIDDEIICSVEHILQEEIFAKKIEISNQNSEVQEINNILFSRIHNVTQLSIFGPYKFEGKSIENLETVNALVLNEVYLNNERDLFNNLNIHYLFMSQCNITKLIPGWFENQQYLAKIVIGGNNITNIPTGVFNNSNLELLMLRENEIKTIEDNGFYGMNNIKILILEENLLSEFNAVSYFGDVQIDLRVLSLQGNNVTKITRNTLSPFPNITVLFLLKNNIEFIEENAFHGLTNITYLDLSSNKLQTLQPSSFQGLSSLDVLFLHNNKFAYIPMETLDNMNNLTKISIGLNPWICSCREETIVYLENRNVTLLCDNNNSRQHKCINLAEENNKCVQEKYEDLYKHSKLFDTLDYGRKTRAPVCHTGCRNALSCYTVGNDYDLYVPGDIQYLLN